MLETVKRVGEMREEKRTGALYVVAGPYGTGKSHFCGSITDIIPAEECLLVATLSREVDSERYVKSDLPHVVIEDTNWVPSKGKYKAEGFQRFLDLTEELRDDEQYRALIIDSGTELGELAFHEACGMFNVGDPSEIPKGGNRFAPYTRVAQRMDEVTRNLLAIAGRVEGLEVAKPKVICCTWHIQPKKESTTDKESSDEKGSGVEYEGEVLPMVKGGFRRRLGQLVDALVYTDVQFDVNPKTFKQEIKYVLQVAPDRERWCKFPGTLPKGVTHIRNNFEEFFDLLHQSAPYLVPRAISEGTEEK